MIYMCAMVGLGHFQGSVMDNWDPYVETKWQSKIESLGMGIEHWIRNLPVVQIIVLPLPQISIGWFVLNMAIVGSI